MHLNVSKAARFCLGLLSQYWGNIMWHVKSFVGSICKQKLMHSPGSFWPACWRWMGWGQGGIGVAELCRSRVFEACSTTPWHLFNNELHFNGWTFCSCEGSMYWGKWVLISCCHVSAVITLHSTCVLRGRTINESCIVIVRLSNTADIIYCLPSTTCYMTQFGHLKLH